MSNEFYAPGDQRAAKVNDLFARIARRYDFLNDLQSFGLHRNWKRRVLELAGVKDGSRALDLCCGTGDIAFGLAKKGAETTGLDFSPQMLEVAAQRHLKSPNPKLKFIQGDAQNLPFADNQFDAVTVGYGLRNLTSWERGVEEMARVARQGVVSFPNFGHWRHIGSLLAGRMPVSRTIPYQWYDTPNIHLCTLKDFEILAARVGLTITGRAVLADGRPVDVLPSLRATLAIYRFEAR